MTTQNPKKFFTAEGEWTANPLPMPADIMFGETWKGWVIDGEILDEVASRLSLEELGEMVVGVRNGEIPPWLVMVH